MNASYNWLRKILKFSESPQEISEILTSTGLEVEGVKEFYSSFDKLLIGKVVKLENHPNADRLQIAKVNVGTSTKQIICGAKNIKKNMHVVVALPGCTITNFRGESLKINNVKIRNIKSEGMLCSEFEFGLNNNNDGIAVMPEDSKVGDSVSSYYEVKKDYVFNLGLTPNRTDAFGHIGVCRDLLAYFNHRGYNLVMEIPDISEFSPNEKLSNFNIDIKSDDLCVNFNGICIDNIKVGESPIWLKLILHSLGLKSVNNVVDITNFVLYETGNPLHAYDLGKINGNKLVVRNASESEKFVSLENKSYKLNNNDIVIADEKNVLCLGGVMGSNLSCVDSSTSKIFLESACFDSQKIRKTSKFHSISTDSSYRFERGVDSNNCEYSLKRAANLIVNFCGGSLGPQLNYNSKNKHDNNIIFKYDYCHKVLGYKIDNDSIIKILSDLGFKINEIDNSQIEVNVPSYRVDVLRPIDLVEEVSRIYGYNNLPSAKNISFSVSSKINKLNIDGFRKTISNLLIANSFFEIQNNSLVPEKTIKFDLYKQIKPVKLLNPLSKDLSVLRTSMIHGMLTSISYNLNRQISDMKFFEFGNTYGIDENKRFIETEKIHIGITGNYRQKNWNDREKKSDIFIVKGIVDMLLVRCGLIMDEIIVQPNKSTDSDSFYILRNGAKIAEFGQYPKEILLSYGIKKEVFFANISVPHLHEIFLSKNVKYAPVSKFPNVSRDLSLLIDKNISYSDIKNSVMNLNISILKNITLFDVYQGDNISSDKKSYSLSFRFQNPQKTLTDREVDLEMLKIFNELKNSFKISLREGELK